MITWRFNLRNWNDPQYKKWRRAVRERDGFQCRYPGCLTSKTRLQVHHIRKWADYPTLRYEISNGITLCRKCHDMIKNKEEAYAGLFIHILHSDMIDDLKKKGKKK